MPSKTRHGLLIIITVIGLFFTSAITSYAETVNYIYDDLNRLIRIEYGGGTVIEYTYDEVGNRLQEIIQLDTTGPTTTASPPGGVYNTIQSITLTCNDGTGVGCDKIYYTTDGSTPTTSSPVYSGPINISITTALKFFARDLAGNSEAVKTQTYTIDTTPPTGTITINSGAASTNSTSVTLTLTCTDAQGCSQMQFSNDNIIYSTPEAYAPSKAWTLSTGDGTKTVYVKFKDAPGNWSSAYGNTILFDTTAPTTTASPAGGIYNTAQTITLICSDGTGSGCDKIYYTTDGSTPTTSSSVYLAPINILFSTTLKYFARDLAGNSEAVKSQIYTLDTLCPNPPVRIGGASYTSLQEAYNAAVNGDVIKCRNVTFIENLTVNRNIAVTLEGGYDCGFTTNVGGQTTIKGTLTTTAGGGTITIKNFVIQQ